MLVGAVVDELQVQSRSRHGAEQVHDFLQSVAVFAGYAQQVALDGHLHFLLTVLDGLHDFAGFIGVDTLLEFHLLADGGSGGGPSLRRIPGLLAKPCA